MRRYLAPSVRRPARALPAVALAAAVLCGAGGTAVAAVAGPAGPRAAVVITLTGGDITPVEAAVTSAGGQVGRALPIVHGFAAVVPVAALPAVAALPSVRSITPNTAGHLLSVDPTLGYDPASDEGSLSWVTKMLGVQSAWTSGITGKGVDVALVDSGVARVPGLASGNVLDGPDLSFESQRVDVRYLDTFGHGTHMASIIAGRDKVGTPASYLATGQYDGVAPDARVVSLKVAAADGAADVSQVIAAIDWVTQHAHDSGLNIRVLNLSYGTDSTQGYGLDPLSYAVEQAWKHGIVVVVAAGNDGTSRAELADPASNPYVLAVGADDPNNTAAAKDDTVPAFAQRGTTARHVDVIAPGVHVLGLRVPNSYVDQNNPAGRVGTRFIRGSGTSQATALASGVAALILQKYPTATPDQVKYLVMNSASKTAAAKDLWQGLGVLDASKALAGSPAMAPAQSFPAATGQGLLEGSRGTNHVALGGVALTGEKDIFARAWNSAAWTASVAGNTAWSGGTFNGCLWTGTGWGTTTSWAAVTWAAADWTGMPWTSRTWVSRTWVNNSWDSRTWVASNWDSRTWVASTWSSASWS